MSICLRIKKVREIFNKSQVEFAESIGITRSSLSQIEIGKHGLTLKGLESVAKKYGIRYQWLIEGEGPVFENSHHRYKGVSEAGNNDFYKSVDENAGKADSLVFMVSLKDKKPISFVASGISSEYIINNSQPEFIGNLPPLEISGILNSPVRGFETKNEDMFPLIHSGDIVLCSKETSHDNVVDFHIYLVVTNVGIMVKRLKTQEGENYLTAISENANFPLFKLYRDQIVELWKVLLVLKNEFPVVSVDGSSSELKGNKK